MFVSIGELTCYPSEAMLKFCEIANPVEMSYHLNSFSRQLQRNLAKRSPGAKFFQSPHGIMGMLSGSYSAALAMHEKCNPHGPLPRQITLRQFSHFNWKIQYVTVAKTAIQLEIPIWNKRFTPPPKLKIFGQCFKSVKKYATLAGLSEIRFELQIPRSVFTLQSYHLQNPRDICIPLSEVMNLIQKYAK